MNSLQTDGNSGTLCILKVELKKMAGKPNGAGAPQVSADALQSSARISPNSRLAGVKGGIKSQEEEDLAQWQI
jgi:hypothetical protein